MSKELSELTKLTDEQQSAYWRWRRQFSSAEAAGKALCPDYLNSKETLDEKQTACSRQRLKEKLGQAL